jgi:hypothetical protein
MIHMHRYTLMNTPQMHGHVHTQTQCLTATRRNVSILSQCVATLRQRWESRNAGVCGYLLVVVRQQLFVPSIITDS